MVCPTGCCYFMVLQIYEPLNNKSHSDMLKYTTTARGLRRVSSVGISSVFSILPPIHVIRITYPDHLQNLINCSLARNIPPFSCKSVHYFLSNQTDRQTDRQERHINQQDQKHNLPGGVKKWWIIWSNEHILQTIWLFSLAFIWFRNNIKCISTVPIQVSKSNQTKEWNICN